MPKSAHLIVPLALVPPNVFPIVSTTAAVIVAPLVPTVGPPVITAAHVPAAAVIWSAAALHVTAAVARGVVGLASGSSGPAGDSVCGDTALSTSMQARCCCSGLGSIRECTLLP